MVYTKTWDEFEKTASSLYLRNPMKIRYVMKYNHNEQCLDLRITDNVVCVQYKTQIMQDIKKIEKFVNNLMRNMVSKE
ncbi:unnamed protein product [Bemisia tabaci]|uniref:Signal recognition particle 9 kDa protein n=1 Tax=Bemisia tabaci TaxID=7038 RepID=A0A9N9ZZV5_BEMTA|nr:PREDICTED: signal recognition particle 9 kDa protein-like [Bemisia tabaci]CAH0381056.1 unnamed protein product [Bemisia tabaci]